MAERTTIAKIYGDLVNGINGIVEPKYIFLGGRLDIKDVDSETMKKFIVIELPTNIEDIAVGNHKFHLTTEGVMYLISEAKKNRTFNINSISDFTEEVSSRFPICGDYIAAANPSVLLRGIDEYGYQIVTITFDIHTK